MESKFNEEYKRIGESKLIEYYSKKGYKVFKNIVAKSKGKQKLKGKSKNGGTPDFLVVKDNEKFYVEEKTDYGGLNNNQEEKIIELIKQGERVLLAKYNSEKKVFRFYEMDVELGRKFIEEVKVEWK